MTADRVSEKIYSTLQSKHYCGRRLNGSHTVGCQSELGGNLGVVWIVESENDFDHILKTGPTPPYIVIMRREYYTRANILNFKMHPDRIAGVVFLDSQHGDSKLRSLAFSPEDRCPNRYSGLYKNDSYYGECKQNLWSPESPISGLLYDDIPFPIFLMNEDQSINDIETCFKNNNLISGDQRKQDTYPLCSMQLDSFMLAAVDTETCLNSRSLMDEFFQSSGQRCYTVENKNIFAYYKPTFGPLKPLEPNSKVYKPSLVEPQSVIMIIAKLSSISMFSEMSPGADSTITAIVTMLAIAEALGHHLKNSEVVGSNRNIAFGLLDSEPFEYTGSSRMVYNMQNNSFPLPGFKYRTNQPITNDTIKNMNLESIEYIINLDQLANYPSSKTIYLHSDPQNSDSIKLDKIVSVLADYASSEKVDFNHFDQKLPLPPSSVQKFIEKSRSTPPEKRLLGLVLSNYGKTYNDLFYHGIYDDSHNIYQSSENKLYEHIAQVSTMIAKSSYELAFGVKNPNIKVNVTLIGELFKCYLDNASCATFTKAMQAGHILPEGGIQTYKDPTKLSDDMNGVITANLLAYFLGDKKDKSYNLTRCIEENDKSYIYNYQFVNNQGEPIKDESEGICIESQVYMVDATSPSFALTETGISVNLDYPAWTVSLNNIRSPARLFIKSSPFYQWCIFMMGVIITLMSFVIVYHIRGSISKLQAESQLQTGTLT